MLLPFLFFFFFNDTATTEIYTLSLHDALPISRMARERFTKIPPLSAADVNAPASLFRLIENMMSLDTNVRYQTRSEEHTSELQSRQYLVCRLLLEKKKENCGAAIATLWMLRFS